MTWQGTVLRVDLTRRKIEHEPLNQSWAEQFLGSRGLGAKYLSELMDPAVDPTSPDNVLIFATGPLTGTMASTSGRYSVITKGALTNAITCSNSGGKFGAELKFAGYDMLIITGRASTPCYLHIVDREVQILEADDLWGRTVWETEDWLRSRHQEPQMKVASIGVAGERGAKYACIVNDLHRAAGRSGVGTVMGSKNLKAIAVRGTVGLTPVAPQRIWEVTRAANQQVNESRSRRGLSRYGTLAMLGNLQEFGGLPTENFRKLRFDGAGQIDARAVTRENANGHVNLVTNAACFGCTIGCGRIAKIDPKHFSVRERPQYWGASGGLEYETAFALGPVVGVSDLDALTFAGFMMNEHGLDPISFGVTLAAAMELYEMKAITDEQTDGVRLEFGNAEALVTMAEKTGRYEGFGQDLGLGSKRLCEKYGHPELAMVSKGQEFAGYDARAMQGMGLGYATSNRGACHLRHDTFPEDMSDAGHEGKAAACASSQNLITAVDAAGVCLFTRNVWKTEDYADMVSAACDADWDVERMRLTGERIWNLERLFNLRAGLTKKDDSLPPRMLKDPAPDGFAKGGVNQLDVLLPEYYRLRGWDEDGVPTGEKLGELGLAG